MFWNTKRTERVTVRQALRRIRLPDGRHLGTGMEEKLFEAVVLTGLKPIIGPIKSKVAGDPMLTRQANRAHEVSHAVMFVLLGGDVTSVRCAGGNGHGTNVVDFDLSSLAPVHAAAASLAGAIGESMRSLGSGIPSKSDRQFAAAGLRSFYSTKKSTAPVTIASLDLFAELLQPVLADEAVTACLDRVEGKLARRQGILGDDSILTGDEVKDGCVMALARRGGEGLSATIARIQGLVDDAACRALILDSNDQ